MLQIIFNFNTFSINKVINDLLLLPSSFRPIYFGENEIKPKSKKDKVIDQKRFEKFLSNNLLGFILFGEKVSYDVSTATIGTFKIFVEFEKEPEVEVVQNFFLLLGNHKPLFGMACLDEEYIHRNRHFITLGNNHIESWIGRDLTKYIPGVYWYTLISEQLMEKYKIKLKDLSLEAIETERLEGNFLHLLRFFDKPENWKKNSDRLDALCEQVDGIFSRKVIEPAIQGATNFFEYSDAIRPFK